MSEEGNRERLIQLIRQIAREEAWEAIDEHLNDFEHKEKPLEEAEVQE
jgi:predicted translin family RNA/ssDNA-binding protein